jgi:hypothetical protein
MYVFFDDNDVSSKCYPGTYFWRRDTNYAAGTYIRTVTPAPNVFRYYQIVVSGKSANTAPTHTSGTAAPTGSTVTYRYIGNTAESMYTQPLSSNASGDLTILFKLPGATYHTGTRKIVVSDTNTLANLNITGSVFGSAKTSFSATGTLQIFQDRISTVDTTYVQLPPPPPPPRTQDPLAQSFFTYGTNGGIFLSSIDIYFNSKDPEIPVTMEIRDMINGYPSKDSPSNASLVSKLEPANISVSTDASVATKFKFEPPVYLKDESDYAFVLISNSKNYNVFTSKMGEKSKETGKTIFDQPYAGSIFKSENSITWTAEQTEDIKFTIWKAKFDITKVPELTFAAVVPPTQARGDQFTTVSGSNVITYVHNHEHGLKVGDKIKIATRTDDQFATVNTQFNGIPYTDFSGEFTITSVPDRNTVKFEVADAATSTGAITSAGIITALQVKSGGTQYQTGDTISFIGGGYSTIATATLTVAGGVVTGITLTNPGAGYLKTPTYIIQRAGAAAGTGAEINISIASSFLVWVNKPMGGYNAKLTISNYGTTTATSTFYSTVADYDNPSQAYVAGRAYDTKEFFPYMNINQNSIIASSTNETNFNNSNYTGTLKTVLKSDNANLSPVINLNVPPTLNAYLTRINNQSGETLTSTNGSSSVSTISVGNAGTGYDNVTPIVTISAPDLPDGVRATAHAVMTGTSPNKTLSSVVVDSAGSGYLSRPTVTITLGDGATSGAGAAAVANMTGFNSEVLPTGGTAKARYLTKKTTVEVVSTGIRIISAISSIEGSSVDWYVRTSMTGSGVHEDLSWQRLNCVTPRNKSSYIGELFDYEFSLDDMSPFNNYDLKCVLTATDPVKAPIVDSYRVIVVA